MSEVGGLVVAGLVVAGLGCRHGVAADAVVGMVREAVLRTGLVPDLLAVPDFKRSEPGLSEAALVLGIALRHVSHEALRAEQPRCVTTSERAGAAVGLRSVAEACALAVAGPVGRLILPRITREGVTCAVAQQGAPCALAQQGAPCSVAQQGAPCALAQQGAPCALAQQGAPCALAQQGAPCALTQGGSAPA